ncbi:hypothetical protein T265_07541 [Opisthorchis viverrini]|uniref:Uncharacterized protein n=1 Tax=Opisthorchis viverrini TaxID=6198 RepID=A0A075ABA6_OPIVI|nr:hypothetical protein T265_07541 [Opisthorchis viverrini]KER24919.1 hypothetical protein T265_07541 [Opisthorchis viverrini]
MTWGGMILLKAYDVKNPRSEHSNLRFFNVTGVYKLVFSCSQKSYFVHRTASTVSHFEGFVGTYVLETLLEEADNKVLLTESTVVYAQDE